MDLPRLKIGSDIETQMGVYIKDRHVPTTVIGKTNTGKSTWILNCWQTDHYYRNAKIMVDPSGFLSRDAYSISGGKYCSLENPISLNPMKGNFSKEQKCDLVTECINQVIKLTVEGSIKVMTPKMRDIFDLSFKACIDKNRLSLLHVLDYIKNLSGDRETRDGLIARLQFLLNDESIRNILCGNNAIEWGDLINKQQTFILDCFGMSREKMIFTGSLVSNGIKNYFRFTRQKEYKPVSIYIDECHNFLNPSMLDIFKEGRKYSVSIICATQDFAVIDEKMTRVMLNSGNIISYKLGYREASSIAKEMNISPQEIQFIEKYHVAYLTPKEKGFAKAPRPAFVREVETPVAQVEPQREVKPSWFTLESYPQPESP